MRLVQVFDGMCAPHSEELMDWYEVRNGSFHRWYPNNKEHKEELKYFDEVNKWLLSVGMVIDEKDEYFSVLLEFWW